jgi:DNA-binding SARP family transcriptional activator
VALPLTAQRVVAFLALNRHPQHRSKVAGTLWMDACEERSSANLRSALWRLRQAGTELIESIGSLVRLGPDVAVDVREAEARAQRLIECRQSGGEDDLSVGGLGGTLLSNWYDDWVIVERERLRQLRLHALEALAERLTGVGRYAEAIQVALEAVLEEPLRESAHGILIAAHLAEGNRYEAILQYRSYCRAMQNELGLGPSDRLTALVVDLMACMSTLAPAVTAP